MEHLYKLLTYKHQMTSASRWDELPSDIQEKLYILRTRLHFADCMEEFKTTGPKDKRAAVIRSIMKKRNKWHKLYMADDSYEKLPNQPNQFRQFVLNEMQVLCDGFHDYDAFLQALFDGATFHELYFINYKVKYTSLETWRCNHQCACAYAALPFTRRRCRFVTCHATICRMYTLDMLEDIRSNMNRGNDFDYETDEEDLD